MGEERGPERAQATVTGADADDPTTAPAPATFRAVPTVALVAVAFLALCLSPIAFQGGPWFLLFLAPLALAVWVVRTRTRVDADGLAIRGLVRSRSVAWDRVTTLRLAERGWVRAVVREGGDVALPGVRIRDLGRVGEASAGRIDVPTAAEAEAAAEHARELEAARLRVARLREQRNATPESAPDEPGTGTGPDEPGTDEHRA